MASDEARRRGFGDVRRGRSRHEMPKRVKSDETASRTMSIMPTAAFIRPEKRNATFSDEAICAGLVGAANLKIAAPTGGRGNRPYQKDEYRWAKKRRALTRQKQQKQNASHRCPDMSRTLLRLCFAKLLTTFVWEPDAFGAGASVPRDGIVVSAISFLGRNSRN